MSGCSLPGNCRAEGIVPGHFSVENQANLFATRFGLHLNKRRGLKKCSSVQDKSASARIEKWASIRNRCEVAG
jgi:hypothetical protein